VSVGGQMSSHVTASVLQRYDNTVHDGTLQSAVCYSWHLRCRTVTQYTPQSGL